MHLKTLTLRGFKSFASATTLRFEPGITCVVGPNGSGKSNVVDALAWVMGEQGAKSLRGGKMEDVIFAGTSSRAPLGRAEVSLTIDNTDGALPIDYTEVTISRLMFRAGHSEYAINGDACRLLDVQDLLSDSGIGREMHVIVGQNQLDTVLHAGPEERRALIEEAAGVLKHRKRKEKALRKLDAMQGNLTRLTDLTGELRRRLKPLGKQAEIARKAATIQAGLRDARLRLLADDLVAQRAELNREAADEAEVRQRRTAVEEQLGAAQQRESELESAAAAAAPRLAEIQQVWYDLSALRERLNGTADLAAERHRHLSSDGGEGRRGRDPDDMEREAGEVRQSEQRMRAELTAASEALTAATGVRRTAEDGLAEEEGRIAAAARAAADRREGLARLRGDEEAQRSRVTAAEDEIGRLAAAVAAAQRRADEADRQCTVQRDQEPDEDPDAVPARERARQRLTAAEQAAERAAAELDAARDTASRARTAHQEAERGCAALTARREALELSLRPANDPAEVLEAADAPAGQLGRVAELFRVAAGAEAAIAAALGDAAEAVAVASVAAAADVLRRLAEHTSGRVTLLIDGAAVPAPARPAELPTGARYAPDLVDAEGPAGAALLTLLADTVVVDDLPAAVAVATRHPGLRAVTTTGELLGATLARGGIADAPSRLEVKAAADQADRDLAAARSEAGHAAAAVTEAEAAQRTAKERAGEATTQVKAARGELAESDKRVRAVEARQAKRAEQAGRLDAAARSARQEAQRLTDAVSTARQAREAASATLAEVTERLRMAEAEPTEEAADVDTGRRDTLAADCAAAREAEIEARLAVRSVEERLKGIAGRADALVAAAERERRAREAAERRRERRLADAEVARAVHDVARQALERITASLETARVRRETAEQQAAAREQELKSVRGGVRDLTAEFDKLVSAVHGSEVVRTEQRLRLEQLETKAVEELGVDVDTLVAEYGPDQPVPAGEDELPVPYVREEQLRRAKSAERDLKQLGKVNPLALEEFAALEERHTFLTTQLEDLKKTRRDLLTVVKEVDERVEQVFTAAYQDVEREFARVFDRLFPGGEGALVLTEPEDMLATGVEVEARPPGKKVKRLSLLSGGERSLTAIAYLVAIFRARPSPFYVLDEVEAALDDTNTQRLLVLFEELRENSQLLVITHQKRTMEIADVLYGVSMRGDGVSTVISQRMTDRAPA